MKTFYTYPCFLLFFFFLCKSLPAQEPQWQYVIGNPVINGKDQGLAKVCPDNLGNIFVLTFPTRKDYLPGYTGYLTENFVQKYNSSGELLWTRHMSSTITAMACDRSGNLYTSGNFTSALEFQDTTLACMGSSDIYLQKMDGCGNDVWVKSISDTNFNQVADLCVSPADDIYLTGSKILMSGGRFINFGPGTNTAFLTKIKNNGQIVWTKNPVLIGDYLQKGKFLTADSASVYLVSEEISSSTEENACGFECAYQVLSKYTFDGMLQNFKTIRARTESWSRPFIHHGEIYIIETDSWKYTTRLLIKLDSSWNTKWLFSLSKGYYEFVLHSNVLFDKKGDLILAGEFGSDRTDTLQVGSQFISEQGGTDIVISTLNKEDGGILNCTTIGALNYEKTVEFVSDNEGNLYLSGVHYPQEVPQPDVLCFGNQCVVESGDSPKWFLAKLKVKDYPGVENSPCQDREVKSAPALPFAIYPNPSDGFFSIQLFSTAENLEVTVHDMLGRPVYSNTFTKPGKIELDLRTRAQGVYFLKALVDGELHQVKLVLK